MAKTQRNDYSRMWLIDGKAGPGKVPSYESFWKAGAVSWTLGDITNIFSPDPNQYGAFETIGKIIGEPGQPTLPVTARYLADVKSVLLRLARLGCDVDVQIHMGNCRDPRSFNEGWWDGKIMILEAARVSQYGTTDMGALTPAERATVEEEVQFVGEELYEVAPIALGQQAAAEIVQEVIGITVCDSATCAVCGVTSDGCQVVFAVTLSAGGSPGLPAEVLYTENGGGSWGDTNVTTLAANEDPDDVACAGTNLIVISEDSESLHYAAIADILDGVEAWSEVTTGFVTLHGPRAVFGLDPQHVWMAAAGGYIYFSDDPTSGVEVQESGSGTAQDLNDIHALNAENVIAVGNLNAVLVSANGGSTWSAITGPAVGVNLNTAWMHSELVWMVGAANGRLYYTQDGGGSWSEKAFPGSGAGSVRDIVFSTPTVGWMAHDTVTPAGRILRTINGGNSWYVAPEGNLSIPANDRINALAVCQDANTIYAAGLGDNAIDGIIVKGA